jgi:ATP-dependent helicase YprA (DUF1998 family)
MREPASWQELRLGPPWQRVVEILAAGAAPRPIQCVALGEQRLLEHRRNVIVAAPTNAGKSLVGLLALLEAIRRSRCAPSPTNGVTSFAPHAGPSRKSSGGRSGCGSPRAITDSKRKLLPPRRRAGAS